MDRRARYRFAVFHYAQFCAGAELDVLVELLPRVLDRASGAGTDDNRPNRLAGFDKNEWSCLRLQCRHPAASGEP